MMDCSSAHTVSVPEPAPCATLLDAISFTARTRSAARASLIPASITYADNAARAVYNAEASNQRRNAFEGGGASGALSQASTAARQVGIAMSYAAIDMIRMRATRILDNRRLERVDVVRTQQRPRRALRKRRR